MKEGLLAYSSPVMLISRKLTKHKRVVTNFRHLNVRIAKNNLAYPLLKDTFSVLGSSICEVLSVLDLKDAFHCLRMSENSKKYCGILPYFGSTSYLYQSMPMGLNISPSIWQYYINTILNCLQSKKYCEAIMDDLLLFTPSKNSHNPLSEQSQKVPRETKIETGKTNYIHSQDPAHTVNNVNEGMIHTRPLIPDVPFYPGLTYRPPPKPIISNMPRSEESLQSSLSVENINPDINLEFE